MTILDTEAVSGQYFFPRRDAPAAATAGLVRVQVAPDVEIAVAHARARRAIGSANGPGPITVIHFHGNGETIADYVSPRGHVFDALEVDFVYVEYRGYGASNGRPEVVQMLGDGRAVMTALGLDPARTVAFGRSVGSLYAIELAARCPELGGLVIESGIADPVERFLRYAALGGAVRADAIREAGAEHFDHRAKLAGYHGPVLILHTRGDHLVDVSHAERNFEWSASSAKELVVFAEGDHNSIFVDNEPAYLAKLAEFLRTTVGGASARV